MNKIGIIANKDRDIGYKYTRILAETIQKKGGIPIVTESVAEHIGEIGINMDQEKMLDSAEAVICLGGDGTFLKAARNVYTRGLPLLGINLGNMGFLTEVEKNDIDNAVDNLINNRFTIEGRMMLDTVIIRDKEVIASDVALNDVVISREGITKILHVKTYINDVFVDTFPGDGLIISSPTGSTAYSLSAGGPIVEPDIEMIIVTPICPHILFTRSFITTGDRAVRAVIDENSSYIAMVTVDGQVGYEVRGGDVIETKRSSHCVKIIRMGSRNFFSVLRKKIYHRGESLKEYEI
ncbi:MAG TPA: NAD(+)/NADH kinase [Clostridiaceae bacterium]|nr:NAD(+)/NADH kinase [Clostridiaceae bacterium]